MLFKTITYIQFRINFKSVKVITNPKIIFKVNVVYLFLGFDYNVARRKLTTTN